MKHNYLVTGAAGFIGSFLSEKIIKKGHNVWSIDNLSTGFKSNLPKKINFIKGNCQDSKIIKKLNNTKFKAILHFAGQSSGEISFENPIYDLEANTESTIKLADYAINNGCSRFIYASSMSVYGTVKNKPINEKSKCQPLSFYGVGKLASENYLKVYEKKGLNFTNLRIFNVYGPKQNLKNYKQGMISIYLDQFLHSKKIIVKGSKKRFRDFIYIDDVINIILRILNNNKTFGKSINIGTGKKTTVNEILNILTKISKTKKSIYFDSPTPGDQKGIFADINFLKKELNYNKYISINDGLMKMYNWAKKNNSIK